ncbi:hypothetical protein, variant [Sphaeroforma arctica JP610]|nr:hypothetical protein, variant [Sphaeroforma arctica JP610]KNC82058.1 hypothetical protein, variant [Sphaeroforma arctica JP610]|eukprot:XP_014155960.1 hypothetical protein, variant [Sphaeroforma arctica JP610]
MRLRDMYSDFRRDGWFIRDCCGIFTALLTHVFIWFAVVVVCTRVIIPMYSESTLLMLCVLLPYLCLACLAGFSHIMCMLSDPGSIKKFTAASDGPEFELDEFGNRNSLCTKCRLMKPHQAHHCSTCNRCIEKMDHHCPWMNNCIGRRNMKHFLLFLLYIFLISMASIGLILLRFFDCKDSGFRDECGQASDLGYLGGVCFEGLLFGLFTCGMMIDVLTSLGSNTSTIDRMNNRFGAKRTCRDGIEDACGGALSWSWLWPFAPSYPKRSSGGNAVQTLEMLPGDSDSRAVEVRSISPRHYNSAGDSRDNQMDTQQLLLNDDERIDAIA